MKAACFALLSTASAKSHENINMADWQTESSGKKIFLDMYAEWCPHCVAMHPALVQLMDTYKDTENILIASADCETEAGDRGTGADICDHYNLPYYPFLLYGTPDDTKEYTGARDYDSLLKLVQKNLGPAAGEEVVAEVQPASAEVVCTKDKKETVVKTHARGYIRQPRNGAVEVATITDEDRAAAPDALDWSTKGATTPVKDQGQCGSCWAYSATVGIESGLYMATNKLEQLAEQQIISCDKTDAGCGGGDLPTAFDYVKKAGGIASQEDYPDTSSKFGLDGKCKSKTPVVKVTGWKYAIPPCESGACKNQKESDMMAALNKFGPLSVCVNAETWDGYNSGIYSKRCSGAASYLDHCVQLVGYDKTQQYWKVRNSWAADWGEDGFIRLPMGKNACGIADEATYVQAELVSEAVEV